MNKLVPKLRFKEFSGKWEEKEVDNVFDILAGGDVPKNELSDKKTQKYNIPILSNGIAEKSLYGWTKKVKIDKPSLTVSARGTIGWTSLQEKPFFPIVRLIVLIPKIKINLIYAYYYMKNIENDYKYAKVGIPQLTKPMIKNTKILIPPTPQEQQKIADTLSSLDKLIEANSKRVEALKEHKKGLMQQLFPTDNEKMPKLRFKEFSGEWENRKLSKISNITTGSSNREDSTENDGKYTFFDRSEDIRTSSRYLFDDEAIIIAGEGQKFTPKYYKGKFDLHQRTYAILELQIIGKFLYYYIDKHKNYFLQNAVGSTVKSLRLPMFQKMPILLPVLPEQQKIADTLSSLDNLIEATQKKVEALKEHKIGLMQQMFVSEELEDE